MHSRFTSINRENFKRITLKIVYDFKQQKRFTHGLHTLVLCIRHYNPNRSHPQCHSGFLGNFADTVRNNSLRTSLVPNTLNIFNLKNRYSFGYQNQKLGRFFSLAWHFVKKKIGKTLSTLMIHIFKNQQQNPLFFIMYTFIFFFFGKSFKKKK